METKELNGYRIQFCDKEQWFRETGMFGMSMNGAFNSYKRSESEVIKQPYGGLVSEIPEELAEKIVHKTLGSIGVGWKRRRGIITEKRADIWRYLDYRTDKYINRCHTANQSFQTLSDLAYCVITRL